MDQEERKKTFVARAKDAEAEVAKAKDREARESWLRIAQSYRDLAHASGRKN